MCPNVDRIPESPEVREHRDLEYQRRMREFDRRDDLLAAVQKDMFIAAGVIMVVLIVVLIV